MSFHRSENKIIKIIYLPITVNFQKNQVCIVIFNAKKLKNYVSRYLQMGIPITCIIDK